MIGIIGAMDVEVSNIINNIENVHITEVGIFKYYTGQIHGKDVVVLRSGIGKVSSAVGATLMINLFKPDFIINSGIAGGVSPLHTKDVCLPLNFTYGDVDATIFGYKKGQVPQMPAYFEADSDLVDKIDNILSENSIKSHHVNAVTSDSFITSLDTINLDDKENIICEMEGTSIAQACHILKTKFVSIRFISDIINSDEHVDNYFKFEEEMANLSSNLLLDILKKF